MMNRKTRSCVFTVLAAIVFIPAGLPFIRTLPAVAGDLAEVKEKGILRHLGIAYANFVTGSGDGLDVELVQLFAGHLGVKYEYVKTNWEDVISDLTGKKVKANGDDIEVIGEAPIKGDIIANGFTVLPWRRKIVDYSTPTFPTQVWLVARADSSLKPIQPTGDVNKDINTVKALLNEQTILGKANTCLDPSLYALDEAGAKTILFPGGINELAPAIINGDAPATILDVPDSLVALEKWPGHIKVIGPLTDVQNMGCAFSKDSSSLRDAFNKFFAQCIEDGTYRRLIEKYYPSVFACYPDFFEQQVSLNVKR